MVVVGVCVACSLLFSFDGLLLFRLFRIAFIVIWISSVCVFLRNMKVQIILKANSDCQRNESLVKACLEVSEWYEYDLSGKAYEAGGAKCGITYQIICFTGYYCY